MEDEDASDSPEIGSQSQPEEIDWWQYIDDDARQYLLQRRKPVEPCPWCGGRLRHGPDCFNQPSQVTMPKGRHKGKRITEVPIDYIKWAAINLEGLPPEVRRAVEEMAGPLPAGARRSYRPPRIPRASRQSEVCVPFVWKPWPSTPQCNHTLDCWDTTGSWRQQMGRDGRYFACRLCGRFYGYIR
jgi:hypothetical protein